jgi:hypothetical protein
LPIRVRAGGSKVTKLIWKRIFAALTPACNQDRPSDTPAGVTIIAQG